MQNQMFLVPNPNKLNKTKMRSCQLTVEEEQMHGERSDIRNQFLQLKEKVDTAKSLLDGFSEERKRRILQSYDVHSNLKHKLKNAENVTNAWLKFFEIGTQFKFEYAFVFLNAEFPGAFVSCVNHLKQIQDKKRKKKDLAWCASSFVNGPLDDQFLLYKRFPQNWLMSEHMNGDITKMENITKIESILEHNVTLYTSDGSIDIKDDFVNQEMLNFKLLVGEMLCALKTLKVGGSAVIKMFSCLEMHTVSAIHHFVVHFEKAHIVKPATSRAQNSELYLVAQLFKGGDTQYEKALQAALEDHAQLVELNDETLDIFYSILEDFANTQCNTLHKIGNSLSKNTPLNQTEKQRAEDIWLSMHFVPVIERYLNSETPDSETRNCADEVRISKVK